MRVPVAHVRANQLKPGDIAVWADGKFKIVKAERLREFLGDADEVEPLEAAVE